jgi:hypothetical protein
MLIDGDTVGEMLALAHHISMNRFIKR